MTKCRIDIDDKYRTSFSTGGLSENKTYEMIMKNGGYYAYSWRVGWPIFAYMLQDLSNGASIKYTNDDRDKVYIAISGNQRDARIFSLLE
ncbi:15731_t:CDS:2 [Funneliformis geosporum]|uniref:15731_t:CDS:1 n=1 Tax=Funneliformis geosporum TaxID=1117311 RepID=A0A9W4SGC5_9GLOM|nr:15731_t:CDS:2 [Funneliformis geosporum]